jgi:excisionase family DNA binding protein
MPDQQATAIAELVVEKLLARCEGQLEHKIKEWVFEAVRAKPPLPPTELYSVKEVAAMTGLKTKHIYRAIDLGKLPKYDVANGDKRASIRIHRRDIDAWVETCKVNQAPPKSERDALAAHYFPDKPKRRRKAA